MDIGEILDALVRRLAPGPVPADGPWLWLALGLAALAVVLPPLWHLLRPAVTIVHELGHAVVGILMGRRFTGFVVSADMSGHAVTVGPRRGIGRILSTGAGYPAPAVVGAVLVQIALYGWARAALFTALCVLVVSLVFTRSGHTVLAVLASAAAVGALWWWGSAALTALLTLAAGIFLLLGAWRHLLTVALSGGRQDDPGQLARLTPVPAALWTASFALVIALGTWWACATLWPLLR